MLRGLIRRVGVAVIFASLPAAVAAPPEPAKPPAKDAGESLVITSHTLTAGGQTLTYEATAGTLPLKDDDGKTTANVFFVAYSKTPGALARFRPITFAFNGGPGSSAVWLHLGAFGPKRVDLADAGREAAPPYRLVDNDTTLLDLTDLVFIDPVSTGYSRATNPQEANKFHSTEADAQSVATFIRQYVTRFDRWESPKYIAGESYGTTRAAALSNLLQDQQGIYLNGVILISAVLNFQTILFDEGNDLPYVLYLPSYTATAWHHKCLPDDLQGNFAKTLEEARRFAEREYSVALLKGGDVSADERQEIATKLARYTGLTRDYVLRSNLRVEASRFRKELLRNSGRMIGRYDSRFEGADLDDVSERPDYDPSYPVVQAPFTALINSYFRETLKYESDLDYRILTGKVSPWDFGARNHYLNTAPSLRQAMAKNPGLRLFIASGIYDLATPFAGSHYTAGHLGLNPAQRSRVSLRDYPAGHMMYIEKESRGKLKADLSKFYQGGPIAEETKP